MPTVVVSQPMFLPWLGLFEQVRLADVYVHYDDVQLPVGRSFMNRVQIKTAQGVRWLTAPLRHEAGKPLIRDVRLDAGRWRDKHLAQLHHAFARAPHRADAMALAESIYALQTEHLAELNIAAIERIAAWLGLAPRFERSSAHGFASTSTQHLLDLVLREGGDVYVTGHGARNYMDFALFERAGVRVRFIDYQRRPYPQLHGTFDPHVTVLDAIANCGPAARELLVSGTLDWRDFMSRPPAG